MSTAKGYGDRHRDLARTGPPRYTRDLLRAALLIDRSADLFANETELMRETGSGRAVLRQAINALADARLISRTRGVGTAVAPPMPDIDIGEYHGSRPDDSVTWIPEINAEVISWAEIEAPALLAARMDVTGGDHCLRIDYVTWWRGTPFAVSTHYLRAAEAARLRPDDLRTDWYPFLRRAGIHIAETAIEWQALPADEFDAPVLNVRPGAPILASDGLARDADGSVFTISFVRARGDSVRVHSRQVLST